MGDDFLHSTPDYRVTDQIEEDRMRTQLPVEQIPFSQSRRAYRTDRRGLAFVVVTSDNWNVRRRVLTLDLSPRGARIQSDVPLTVGQLFDFVPSDGAESAVSCRVVWAGELGSSNEFESGLEFLAPLPTDLPA